MIALGLVALAGLLLATAFADVQEVIDAPEAFTPDERLVNKGAEALSDAPPGTQQAALDAAMQNADVDLLRLLEDGTITLPEGTTIEDGMVQLGDDVEWTLPAGSHLEDLEAPLAAGTELVLPEGTTFEDGAVILPPGSTLRGADGGALDLPGGGRIEMPGWSAAELRVAAEDGTFRVPGDATLHAPVARTTEDWPLTLSKGTRFAAPEDWQLPDGTLAQDETMTLPAGWSFDPEAAAPSTGEQSEGAGIFDRLGAALRNSEPPVADDPKTSGETDGPSIPTLTMPAGMAWLYGILLLAAAGVLWWVWRRRGHRLRQSTGGLLGSGDSAPANVRIVHQMQGRSAGLPLALAPGQDATLTFHVETRRRPDGPWQRAAARVIVRLDGDVVLRAPVADADAPVQLPIPARPAGESALSFEVTPGTLGRTETVTEPLHVAPWDQQVARDYQALYDAAEAVLPTLPDGLTPRLLRSALCHSLKDLDEQRLDAAILVFERANYSTGTVDEADWLRFAATTHALQRALDATLPGEGGPAGETDAIRGNATGAA